MSAAVARPLADPGIRPEEPPRRRLEVVPTRAQRRARPRLLPAVITMAGIGAVLMGQLLLSIVLADGAYQIAALQAEQRDLQRQQDALAEDLEIASSTQNLTASAEQLGMVASGAPAFLDVSTGAIVGNAAPAGGSLIGSGQLVGNLLTSDVPPLEPTATDDPPTIEGSTPPPTGEVATPTAPGSIPSPTTR